jgi:DNA-binding NarL/FixJ family response regulator
MVKSLIKVLIVDDRAAVRESLRTILSLEEDFEVVGEASSGREAVKQAQELHPDVVLMDLEMPDIYGEPFDGIIACGKIKQEKSSNAVVILTVHADHVSRQRAAQAGCDLFLEKGINSFELLSRLRDLGNNNHP